MSGLKGRGKNRYSPYDEGPLDDTGPYSRSGLKGRGKNRYSPYDEAPLDDTGPYSRSGLKGRGKGYAAYDDEVAGKGAMMNGSGDGYGKWAHDRFDEVGYGPAGGKGGKG